MKKFLLPSIALLASLVTAQAQQFFTNGNLAVVRQSGYDTTSSTGVAVFIDQFSSSGVGAGGPGTPVSSLAIPTSGPNAIILNGEYYEGLLNLALDGNHLVFAGYNTSLPYASNIISSEAALVHRAVVTVDAYGNVALPVIDNTNFNDSAVTSACSDGTNYWMVGTGSTGAAGYNEIVYVGTAAAGATNQVATNLFTSGAREVTLYNVGGTYELFGIGYTSQSSFSSTAWGNGGYMLSNINGDLPTNGTGFTNLFPTGGANLCVDLVINPAGTIAYVADADIGIVKFTSSPNGWVSNYYVLMTNGLTGYTSASSQHAISVTADFTQNPPVVYAVTDDTPTNRLVSFQDNGPTSPVTILATATENSSITNSFHGVRFVPNPYAYISVPPAPFTGAPGEAAIFAVTAVGNPTPTYQWYTNSVSSPTFVAVPGATSPTFSVPNINVSETGSEYYVVVSNVYGTSQSAPVTLTVLNPAITSEPMGTTNLPNSGPQTLCVTAIGTGTLTYQWLSNGVAISGAQSSCYTVPNSAVSNEAAYSVIVSNSLNESAISSPTVVSFSPYLLYDTFDYPNGPINEVAGSPWTEESGSNPIYETNGFVQINQNIGNSGTAFVQSLYTQPQSGQILWASFIVNLTNLPATPSGTYFAYFQSTNFNFYGRIIALTSNNPSYTLDISPVAAPGTYRLGIANDQTTASAVVELDMAPGIDYQVVAYYDMVNGFCQLAVNPSQTNYGQVYAPFAAPSPLASAITSDRFTPASLPMAAYGLRQAADAGVINLTDLQVSYDWNGAGSGYAAVTAGITTTKPVIGYLTPGFTNYSGNSNYLEVAASGVGLSYRWCQNGLPLTDGYSITGSGTPVLALSPLEGTNSGDYTVIVSDSDGSVTSAVVDVSVNTTITAPIFTLQPVSTVSSLGQSVTFTAAAVGTGPITYEWYSGGSPIATGPSFTLTDLQTNMTGTEYSVTAVGGTGLSTTSTNAVLTVNGPIPATIAYLRSLMVTSAAPVITLSTAPAASAVYSITGTVSTYANLETSEYNDYIIQDNTGGMEIFIDPADTTFNPLFGDVVNICGTLAIYDDDMEFDGATSNPGEPHSIVSTNGENQPFPYAPLLLPFSLPTANPGLVAQYYCGAIVTVTNCYIQTNLNGGVFANEGAYIVSNAAGISGDIAIYTGESDGPDIIGQPIPSFAYSITAPLLQYDTGSGSYELNVTSISNIVTAPPPPVTNMTAAVSGTNITLRWTTVPASYTYSVWSTTNLTVPFAPLAPGLWFSNSVGTYTAAISTNIPATFYEIVSP